MTTHFLYMPLTGLGLYGGHRGKRWLRNRLKIFKQFVLPSLVNQTNKNFILWVSVRHEDRYDPLIKEFREFLEGIQEFKTVFTYAGVCFWDDKFPDAVAFDKLVASIHNSIPELLNVMGEAKTVLMTIQPSDDVYHLGMVDEVQKFFAENQVTQVYGYKKGFVMDYINRRLSEWNPETTPPFYTIRFPRETFANAMKHVKYIGPYKSHEYVKDFLPAYYTDERGFLVGTHGENISTIFNHPYNGHEYLGDNVDINLEKFGLAGVLPLKLKPSLRRSFMRMLPYGWQRKLRYLIGEKFFAKIYDSLRS